MVRKDCQRQKNCRSPQDKAKAETAVQVLYLLHKDKNNHFWIGKRYSYADDHSHNAFDKIGSGKIIGEFICNQIYELAPLNYAPDDVEKQARLTREEIVNYLNGTGYGWHISDLKIYDTPKELAEFHTQKKCKSCSKSGYESTACSYDENCMVPVAITKAPQSWCYVEEV